MKFALQKNNNTTKRKSMNNKFDELTKSLAQSVTRRAALKKFGVGLAGLALACFGLASKAGAATYHGYCQIAPGLGTPFYNGFCMDIDGCIISNSSSPDCPTGPANTSKNSAGGFKSACGYSYKRGVKCSFTV